jgi:hypothetical protein
MKKPIALLLISIMVLMLSAFSFADVDYSLEIKAPDDEIVVEDWDEPFFITVWVEANVGDKLENLVISFEDEESDYEYTFNRKVKHVFDETVFEYSFEAPELTPMDEFKITVVAEFEDNDIEGVEDSKSVVVVEEDENGEDDEDGMLPAATAIANMLLKEVGIPNRVEGVNLIAAVAAEMAKGDAFEDDDMKALEGDVEDFLVDLLNDILDESKNDLDEFKEMNFDMMNPSAKPEVAKVKPQADDVDDDDNDEEEEEEEDDDDQVKVNPGKGNKK